MTKTHEVSCDREQCGTTADLEYGTGSALSNKKYRTPEGWLEINPGKHVCPACRETYDDMMDGFMSGKRFTVERVGQ